ncbi:MAG: transcription antitermination factor NusB [Anaerolineaceae bacterium]|nr:transcription antitermination factor NusB [Anaerolineaceae bacterium]
MNLFPDFNMDDVEKTEVVEHDPALTERSTARRVALQVLYEIDVSGHGVGTVLETRQAEQELSKRSARHLRQIVLGVIEHRERLDITIHHFAPEWPPEQMAIVDRNILRMAIYELFFRSQVVNVVIAEAVELAKLFGAEGTMRFVNGVLAAIAENSREAWKLLSPPVPPDEKSE